MRAFRDERDALAFLERVGCWPSEDPETRRLTDLAERVLRLPRTYPSFSGCARPARDP